MINGNPLHGHSHALWDYMMDVSQPRTALDIGANIGGYSNIMLAHGIREIHAFEPVQEWFDILVKDYGKDSRMKCFMLGASDSVGVVKDVTVVCACTLGREGQYDKLGVNAAFVDKPKFDVNMTTIDSHCESRGFQPGFVKLDVDGYEFRVLKGGEKTLKEHLPPIYCEFAPYVGFIGDSIPDFVRYIFWLGYDVFSLDGEISFSSFDSIHPHYPYHTSFDVMLIPRHLTESIHKMFPSKNR